MPLHNIRMFGKLYAFLGSRGSHIMDSRDQRARATNATGDHVHHGEKCHRQIRYHVKDEESTLFEKPLMTTSGTL